MPPISPVETQLRNSIQMILQIPLPLSNTRMLCWPSLLREIVICNISVLILGILHFILPSNQEPSGCTKLSIDLKKYLYQTAARI